MSPKALKALIVDDEAIARRAVVLHLTRHSDIEVIGECSNGIKAVEAIKKEDPDIVFMDVQMPGMSGFEVIEELIQEDLPAVIFVTAHDEHAVRAFEVNAIDYLLKPFDEVRFDAALARARKEIHNSQQGALVDRLHALLEHVPKEGPSPSPDPRYVRRLLLRDRGRILFIDTEEADWIEAAGNYATLHVGKSTYLLRTSMAELERKLDPSRFVRIHRGTIVNLSRIQEVQLYSGSDYRVVLVTGERLNVSRGYSERLLRDQLR